MATAHTRTIRARRLGLYLKQLREGYGLEIAELAERVAVNHMTVRRVEKGLHRTDVAVLEKLFDFYELVSDRRDELLSLAATAFRHGWWIQYGDVIHDVFAVMEDEADQICSYQSQVVPGILQTDAYARALFESALPLTGRRFPLKSADDAAQEAAEIEKRVQARRTRQAVLDRRNPPRLHAVLGEAVLRQQVGGSDVMRGQLTHLAAMADRDTVTLQVLPFDAGTHVGLSGPFIIFEYDHPDDPDIAHTENLSGSAYSDTAEALTRFRLAWGSVTEAALPPQQSVELIAALASRGDQTGDRPQGHC